MRHTVCSVLKINISSQDMQEIIIYKTIKKNLYCNQQRYFKWGHNHFQQQLPELFYKNAVLKFCNILRKTPVLESPSGLHLWVSDFIKKRLQHRNFWEHLYRRTAERCSVIKRNCWNVLLSIFMFSCANLYYKYAQSNSYRVLNLKSVKITDMKSTAIWISYHFWTCKYLDKLHQKGDMTFFSFISVNFRIGLHVKVA